MPVNSFYLQDTETKRPCWAQPSGSSEEVEKDQHEESDFMEETLGSEGSAAADKDAPEGQIDSDVQ